MSRYQIQGRGQQGEGGEKPDLEAYKIAVAGEAPREGLPGAGRLRRGVGEGRQQAVRTVCTSFWT